MTSKRARLYVITTVASFMVMYHILAGVWGSPNSVGMRFVHLSGAMIIVMMSKPFSKKHTKLAMCVDVLLGILTLVVLVYIMQDLNGFALRGGSLKTLDVVLGTIYLLVLLELARRAAGWVMVVIAVVFFVQNLFANYLPGFLHHRSITYLQMIDYVFVRIDGIIGSPVTAMATFVVLFMMFAALLNQSHAGDFFIDLATAVTGKSRGGPAKAAVVASASFGTISGSAVANVAGTGSITIPLMKRIGYEKNFAGAVEAVSSTGGQIMPPMMGAAAFILAQNVGIPYIKVAACAALPAILYFTSVFFIVDFRAGKLGLKGTPDDAITDLRKTFAGGWQLMLPIFLVVYLLAIGKSAQYSALWAMLLLLFVSTWRAKTRMDGRNMLEGLMKGISDIAGVSVTAGVAGIIIGGVTNTSLNLIFANQIMKISGGHLLLALFLVAVVSLLLGMGMTTTAVYLTVATIMAPALVKMGVNLLAAHMFCFYFGCICTITPPVALASFTAAGISGGSPSKTGWISFRIGIVAYLVPFIFVYEPALLLQDAGVWKIVQAAITALIGTWGIAVAMEGWCTNRVSSLERLGWFAGAISMMIPGSMTDIIGIAIFAALYLFQRRRTPKPTVAA